MLSRAWRDRSRYRCIPVKTEPSYLLVHRDHPFAARSSVSLSMLRDERFLALDKTSYLTE